MYEKIKEVLVEKLHVDVNDITPDADIKKDLGADSLDILQLLMSLEEEYDIQIPDDKLAGFVTVQEHKIKDHRKYGQPRKRAARFLFILLFPVLLFSVR